MNDAILAAIILAPLIITFTLKSNAALAFLALCAGYTVQSFAVKDVKQVLDVTASSFITTDTLSALLILVPLLITLIICRGPSSRKVTKPKVFLNLLAALAAGATLALMTVPFFNYVGNLKLTDSQIWSFLHRAQPEIIGIGALLSLILIWMGNRKSHAKDKHKKHH